MPLVTTNNVAGISPISLGLALKNKASPTPLQPLKTAMKKPVNLLTMNPPSNSKATIPVKTTSTAPITQGTFGGTPALPNQFAVGASGVPTPTGSSYSPQTNIQTGQNNSGPRFSSFHKVEEPEESLYKQYIKKLGSVPELNIDRSKKAQDDLFKFQKSESQKYADIYSQPSSARVMQGREAIVQQANAQLENALSQNVANALTGQGQQITQQGQAIGALGTAGGLLAPQLGQYGQTFYNPLTGTVEGGQGGSEGALNPLNNVPSIAQQVLNGQISPQQAYQLGGSVPNFQGVLNAEILRLNPKANLANLQGSYDARQSNVTTAGTAPTNTFAGAYQQNYPEFLQVQGQLQNVDQLGNLLLTTASGGEINPFAPQLANRTIAYIRSQLSNTDQAKFNSTLAAFQGAASQLLSAGSGQIPTDVSKNIAAISNGSLSMGALKAMVDQAKIEGQIKLQTAGSLVNQPGGQIGAPRVSVPQTTQTPVTNTGGGSDYQAYLKAIGQ